MDRAYSVLFISRRNSARSLMAEAVVNRRDQARFRAFSAAVGPTNDPDPLAIEVLERAGYPTKTLRPKLWRKFTGPDASVADRCATLTTALRRKPGGY